MLIFNFFINKNFQGRKLSGKRYLLAVIQLYSPKYFFYIHENLREFFHPIFTFICKYFNTLWHFDNLAQYFLDINLTYIVLKNDWIFDILFDLSLENLTVLGNSKIRISHEWREFFITIRASSQPEAISSTMTKFEMAKFKCKWILPFDLKTYLTIG